MLDSIRAGVSPDLTVAYVDILFSDRLDSPERPLNQIGQPRFPITLRICGLGTYFSPWYIDTNDVLMHAISQSHEIGVFIDKAWVKFIVDLNNHLRTIRVHRMHRDLPRLLQFLNDERQMGALGGIVIHFCTYLSTLNKMSPDDLSIGSTTTNLSPVSPKSESTLELPNSKPGELAEFNTPAPEATSQQLPGMFMGFFSDPRRNSGDSMSQANKTKSSEETPDNDRFSFGRNSTTLRRRFFPDMFGQNDDEEQGAGTGAAARKRGSSRATLTQPDQARDTLDNFEDVCDAVSSGLRMPGIVIFHESTPLEDVVGDGLFDVIFESDGKRKLKEEENERESMVSVDLAGNARDAYGERAEELEKFYKIVRAADKTADGASMSTSLKSSTSAEDMRLNSPNLRTSQEVVESPVSPSDEAPTATSHVFESFSDLRSSSATETIRNSRKVSFAARDEDGVSVEMTVCSASSDESEGNRGDLRPFSPYSRERTTSAEEYVLSSGHLYPLAMWKWSDTAQKAVKIVITKDAEPRVTEGPSQLHTLLSMIYATLGLKEGLKDMRKKRPIYAGMDDATARRTYNSELFITCVTFCSRVICNGFNRRPLSTTFRKLVGILLAILNSGDIALSCFICINMWCIWGDSTECDNQNGFILAMLIWPGALVVTPLLGLYTSILTSTGQFARQYACWSRLALFSIATLFIVYLSFVHHAPLETLWYLLGLLFSRIVQIALVDTFISCHENRRINRGWDGLFTNILRDEYYFN